MLIEWISLISDVEPDSIDTWIDRMARYPWNAWPAS